MVGGLAVETRFPIVNCIQYTGHIVSKESVLAGPRAT